MITPSFALTATERVLPKLALDFTTAVLDPRVTLTRAGNTATVINSSGLIELVNANLPRFDHNPSTLVCRGLLTEESRTNVLLNSLIDGTSLATQSVTVTAAARTLSFYGTGTVVLSGTHSATVVGTGAYPTRTTLTFTPSAGVLTLTVTGTVQFAQLEAGTFATSYIPTEATAVNRDRDSVVMTSTNFSDWFSSAAGTFMVSWTQGGFTTATASFILECVGSLRSPQQTFGTRFYGRDGSNVALAGTPTTGTTYKSCIGYTNGAPERVTLNGGNVVVNGTNYVTAPTSLTLSFSTLNGNFPFNGWIRQLNWYQQQLINAELSAVSK